jgi:DNA-binding transcriptional ArsR family regulator
MAQPVRMALLRELREPDSAAGVARRISQTRQKVNYHLKELQREGLVRRTGERRKGNFVEQLFQSVANHFVVSPMLGWDEDKVTETLRDQVALSQLADLGERLQVDAAALIDRAVFEQEQIPSLTVTSELKFSNEQSRNEFMKAYMDFLTPLLKQYGKSTGSKYQLALAVYPDTSET